MRFNEKMMFLELRKIYTYPELSLNHQQRYQFHLFSLLDKNCQLVILKICQATTIT